MCKALIEKKRSADELEAFARFVTENGLGLKIIETPKNDLERMNNELYTLLSLDIAQHQQLDLIRVHICWYAKLQCYERLRESSKKYREQAVKYYPEGERAIYDAWIFEKAIGLISSKMCSVGFSLRRLIVIGKIRATTYLVLCSARIGVRLEIWRFDALFPLSFL